MLAVDGYYNGTNIIIDKDIFIEKGQRVLVVLESPGHNEMRFDIDSLVSPTERGKNVEQYMEEMRANDRL